MQTKKAIGYTGETEKPCKYYTLEKLQKMMDIAEESLFIIGPRTQRNSEHIPAGGTDSTVIQRSMISGRGEKQ